VRGATLAEATSEELRTAHSRLEEGDRALADPRAGVAARSGRGGPAPEEVARQIGELRAAAATLL
jgi:argininosuccinate lyase